MAEKVTYSIRDLEELSGIPAHTIRTWERRYRLFSPSRSLCNTRYYCTEDISYLQQVAALLRQGHRISSIAEKTRDEIAWLAKESALTTNDSDLTETLCLALQDFDALKVESILNCYIRKEGFDQAIVTRFVPFLNQLGFLLLSGVLQQLHVQIFYSTLRQKVLAALDVVVPTRESLRWVLIQDDETMDTIYRDIMHYLLRKGGNQVVVVGSMNPTSITAMLKNLHADGYCLVAIGENANDWVRRMLPLVKPQNGQGKTLVFVPGKTLDIVNNSQTEGIIVLPGLHAAFNHLLSA